MTANTPLWKEMRERQASAQDILTHFDVRMPPVDVAGIAAKLGVDVREVDSVSSAYLDRQELKPRIHFWEGDSATARRYRIALQLGELLLTPPAKASRFAAELLVPQEMLVPLLPQIKVAKLPAVFQVSTDVILYRVRLLMED